MWRWVSNNWEWMIWVQSWLRPFHNRFAVTSRVEAADAVSMSLFAPLPSTANSESYVVSKKPFLWREKIKNCFLTKLKIICTELSSGVGEEHPHFAFSTEHWVKPSFIGEPSSHAHHHHQTDKIGHVFWFPWLSNVNCWITKLMQMVNYDVNILG